jgi:hypothetical protein
MIYIEYFVNKVFLFCNYSVHLSAFGGKDILFRIDIFLSA